MRQKYIILMCYSDYLFFTLYIFILGYFLLAVETIIEVC
jgi:hypothetical protein